MRKKENVKIFLVIFHSTVADKFRTQPTRFFTFLIFFFLRIRFRLRHRMKTTKLIYFWDFNIYFICLILKLAHIEICRSVSSSSAARRREDRNDERWKNFFSLSVRSDSESSDSEIQSSADFMAEVYSFFRRLVGVDGDGFSFFDWFGLGFFFLFSLCFTGGNI